MLTITKWQKNTLVYTVSERNPDSLYNYMVITNPGTFNTYSITLNNNTISDRYDRSIVDFPLPVGNQTISTTITVPYGTTMFVVGDINIIYNGQLIVNGNLLYTGSLNGNYVTGSTGIIDHDTVANLMSNGSHAFTIGSPFSIISAPVMLCYIPSGYYTYEIFDNNDKSLEIGDLQIVDPNDNLKTIPIAMDPTITTISANPNLI